MNVYVHLYNELVEALEALGNDNFLEYMIDYFTQDQLEAFIDYCKEY